jgi:hypothetical protein
MLGFSLPRTTPTNSTGATDEIYFCLCIKFRLYPWCVSVPKKKQKYRRHLKSFWPYGPKPSPRASLTPSGRCRCCIESCSHLVKLPKICLSNHGVPRAVTIWIAQCHALIMYLFGKRIMKLISRHRFPNGLSMCFVSGLLTLSLEFILL